MRVDRALGGGVPRPDAQAAPDVRGRQPAAGLRQEEGGLLAVGHERAAGALEVAGQGTQRRLTDGHEAGLAPLALDADLLGIEVEARDVERHELLGPQPRGVGELEQRPVAHLERGRRADPVEQPRDRLRLEDVGQVARLPWRREQVGRIGTQLTMLDQGAVERLERGELARDGGGGDATLGQQGGVAAQDGVADLDRREPELGGPGGELPEVRAVRAARARRGATTVQDRRRSGPDRRARTR
jgi:hypothetical protein